jgi:hypothetical protein
MIGNVAGASAASAGAAGGLNLMNGGNGAGVDNGGANGNGLPDACAADITTAKPIPLDMYIMLDVSSSMLEATSLQISKWDAVKAALEAFLKDDASTGLGVGLQYFPLQKPGAPSSCTKNSDCGDSAPCFLKACDKFPQIIACDQASDCINPNDGANYGPCAVLGQCAKNPDYVCRDQGLPCGTDPDTGADLGNCVAHSAPSFCLNTESCDIPLYAAPSSPIAELPGSAAALVASIDKQTPSGATPTAPALSGAIQQASAWAKAHPDHRVVTVLATDGLPTQCAPTEIDLVANIAKGGVTATPSISTFVIGVFGPADAAANAPDNLNQIAKQGGSKQAFIVDTTQDVTKQFLSALDTIRGGRLACQFQIPQPSSNEMLDYGRVNVQLTSGTQKSVVYYVKDAATCDPTTGGWYYDVDPALGAPTQIVACPSSCTQFQAASAGASVGIALGCTTIVK